MNIERCNPGQRTAITTLNTPLFVKAGAGSGKTFTLTRRVVHALLPVQAGGAGRISNIDEALIITFTEKAAAELKARIKSLLLAEGLVDQALRVDGAWVSTIHAMCSRILREHALEIGIDPAFEVLQDVDAQPLMEAATEAVVARVRQGLCSEALSDLVRRVPLTASGRTFGTTTLVDMAGKVLDRVRVMPGGFDALVVAPPRTGARELLRPLWEQAREFFDMAQAWKKPKKADEANVAALATALPQVEEYLASQGPNDFADPAFDADAYLRLVFSFPKTSPKYHAKDPDADFFAEWRHTYGIVAAQARACCAYRDQCAIVEFARALDEEFAQVKGPSRLTQNDLLTTCARALASHPGIAAGYRERFGLIMVDEFQDTDKLQVSIVNALAAPDLSNVCTVGDAQQSIYRFRGADVNVFYDYRDQLVARNQATAQPMLDENFRSHADVLAFVERVFAQESVWGRDFLSLKAKGRVNGEADPLFADEPRIEISVVDKAEYGDGSQMQAARRIARRFANLREKGAKPGDMVVLLGAMTSADVYARALAEEGFESLITGGSVFNGQPEVGLLVSLATWLANPLDAPALLEVLQGGLFALSDSSLLALAYPQADDLRKHDIAVTFDKLGPGVLGQLGACDADELTRAHDVLFAAEGVARREGLAAGLRQATLLSGWLHRLEAGGAQGLFCAGNVIKVLRMAAELDGTGLGLAQAAERLRGTIELSKEKPGSLSTASSDFVRIMTIHASKGLEFPHVAVAEMRLAHARVGSLVVENVGDASYLAFPHALDESQKKIVDELEGLLAQDEDDEGDFALAAHDPGKLTRMLRRRAVSQEDEEARRLYYVALTRASKSLHVSFVFKSSKDDPYANAGVLADTYAALGWGIGAGMLVASCEYGGTAPARVILGAPVPAQECAGEGEQAEPRPLVETVREFVIPLVGSIEDAVALPRQNLAPRRSHEGMWSYSSLPHAGAGPANASHQQECDPDDVADEPREGVAVGLGSAFHLLAQQAIERARAHGSHELVCPDAGRIADQAAAWQLVPSQVARLEAACSRWFGSDCAREFAAHAEMHAEVPFVVTVAAAGGSRRYLEGSIDALATDGDGVAHVIDYKTGGHDDETPEQLRAKHLLQAQCYALALLKEGFERVEATFVRVERADAASLRQPQTVHYSFVQRDEVVLEEMVGELAE